MRKTKTQRVLLPQAAREEVEFRRRVLEGRALSSHVFDHYIILASAGNGDGGAMGVTPGGGGGCNGPRLAGSTQLSWGREP